MRIEALSPLHIRRAAGDLHLRPGVPVDLPDDEATKLLEKVPGKVRVVVDAEVIIEPAVKWDGSPLKPVYWERQGRIIGPGQPEFFFRDSAGQAGLIIRYQGDLVSGADIMLRSRKAFEAQRDVQEVELIRWF